MTSSPNFIRFETCNVGMSSKTVGRLYAQITGIFKDQQLNQQIPSGVYMYQELNISTLSALGTNPLAYPDLQVVNYQLPKFHQTFSVISKPEVNEIVTDQDVICLYYKERLHGVLFLQKSWNNNNGAPFSLNNINKNAGQLSPHWAYNGIIWSRDINYMNIFQPSYTSDSSLGRRTSYWLLLNHPFYGLFLAITIHGIVPVLQTDPKYTLRHQKIQSLFTSLYNDSFQLANQYRTQSIIGGDFNLQPQDYAQYHLDKWFQYHDANRLTHVKVDPVTKQELFKGKIDWIFFTHQQLQYRVGYGDIRLLNGINGSDHIRIYIDIFFTRHGGKYKRLYNKYDSKIQRLQKKILSL